MPHPEVHPLRPDTPYRSAQTELPPLSTLSEAARQEAMARFQIIQPFVERGIPLPEVARHHGVALRTARRWVQRYRAGGLVALSRTRRASPGIPRRVPPDMAQRVEALALQTPPLSVAAIHRQVLSLAAAHGTPAPCYRTVYNIIRRITPALRTLAHHGSKVYHETFDLLYRREANAPNAIWQADHTLLDILLTDEKGPARKPWLTVILDDYSRAVAGYMVAFEAPSALHTALALRQAIWRKLGFYLPAPRTGLRGPENPGDLFPGGPAPGARPHRTLLQYRESTAARTVAGLCPGRIHHPGHTRAGSAGLHPGLRALCAP